jgi:hypothetical protein
MLFSILAVLIFVIKASAADTNTPTSSQTKSASPMKIGASDATNYYDQTMIVTGKVVQVTIRPTVTFLNLDKPFPNSPFAIVIIHGKSSFYGDANVLKGKSVEVSGKIKNYHDKPEMPLGSTDQLTVVGVTNLELFLKPKTVAPATSQPTSPPPATPATNGIPEIL